MNHRFGSPHSSRIYWPLHCNKQGPGFIVGWNVSKFIITVATVVPKSDLSNVNELQKVLDEMCSSSEACILRSHCSSDPIIIGEWLGNTTLTNSHTTEDTSTSTSTATSTSISSSSNEMEFGDLERDLWITLSLQPTTGYANILSISTFSYAHRTRCQIINYARLPRYHYLTNRPLSLNMPDYTLNPEKELLRKLKSRAEQSRVRNNTANALRVIEQQQLQRQQIQRKGSHTSYGSSSGSFHGSSKTPFKQSQHYSSTKQELQSQSIQHSRKNQQQQQQADQQQKTQHEGDRPSSSSSLLGSIRTSLDYQSHGTISARSPTLAPDFLLSTSPTGTVQNLLNDHDLPTSLSISPHNGNDRKDGRKPNTYSTLYLMEPSSPKQPQSQQPKKQTDRFAEAEELFMGSLRPTLGLSLPAGALYEKPTELSYALRQLNSAAFVEWKLKRMLQSRKVLTKKSNVKGGNGEGEEEEEEEEEEEHNSPSFSSSFSWSTNRLRNALETISMPFFVALFLWRVFIEWFHLRVAQRPIPSIFGSGENRSSSLSLSPSTSSSWSPLSTSTSSSTSLSYNEDNYCGGIKVMPHRKMSNLSSGSTGIRSTRLNSSSASRRSSASTTPILGVISLSAQSVIDAAARAASPVHTHPHELNKSGTESFSHPKKESGKKIADNDSSINTKNNTNNTNNIHEDNQFHHNHNNNQTKNSTRPTTATNNADDTSDYTSLMSNHRQSSSSHHNNNNNNNARGFLLRDFSNTVRTLDHKFSYIAVLPTQWLRLRQRSKWQDSFTRATLVSFWNTIILLLADLVIGFLLCIIIIWWRTLLWAYLADGFLFLQNDILTSTVEWLLGWPAGLKLNDNLDAFLGECSLYIIGSWSSVMRFVFPWGSLILCLVGLSGCAGFTVMLSLVSDLLALATVHVFFCYHAALHLYGLTISGLGSLLKMFRGQKWNVLRLRVDSADFDVEQLLLGTLIFALLFWLTPTIFIYYLFFVVIRVALVAVQHLLWTIIRVFELAPIFPLILYFVAPVMLPGGIYFQILNPNVPLRRYNYPILYWIVKKMSPLLAYFPRWLLLFVRFRVHSALYTTAFPTQAQAMEALRQRQTQLARATKENDVEKEKEVLQQEREPNHTTPEPSPNSESSVETTISPLRLPPSHDGSAITTSYLRPITGNEGLRHRSPISNLTKPTASTSSTTSSPANTPHNEAQQPTEKEKEKESTRRKTVGSSSASYFNTKHQSQLLLQSRTLSIGSILSVYSKLAAHIISYYTPQKMIGSLFYAHVVDPAPSFPDPLLEETRPSLIEWWLIIRGCE